MARNLKKEILHAEFDVTKMLRQRGTGLSAAIDGYGGAEAGHLDEGIYSATNGAAIIPEGAIITDVWMVCSTIFADDASGGAATVSFGTTNGAAEFFPAVATTVLSNGVSAAGIIKSNIVGDHPILLGTSETKDFGEIADGNELEEDVAVSGAAIGDVALATLGVDTVDLQVTASVTAADTVTVVVSSSGSTVDLASTSLNAIVIKGTEATRETVSGEIIMTTAADDITAGKVDMYVEYIATGLIA